MDDVAALLRAVRARPDDDTPRLAYADWLEDHARDAEELGRDPQEMLDRARVIRVQVGLARGTAPDGRPLDGDQKQRLEREGWTLLDRHRPSWDRPLQDLGASIIIYRRGFPDCIAVKAEQLLADADRIFAVAPIRDVYLIVPAGGVRALAGLPALANLTGLNLDNNNIGDDGARALAGSPHLRNLRALDLRSNNIGDSGAEALAGSPHLRHLTSLDLSYNAIGPAGAWALAGSPYLSTEAKVSALESLETEAGRQLARQVRKQQEGRNHPTPG